MNKIWLSSLLLATAVLTGCQSGGAYAPKNATKYDLENKEKFVLMDSMVQRSVTASGIQKRLLPDGRLEVIAHVRNRETRRIQVQINCVFKDASGFSTDDETPWQNLILTENAQEDVRFVSINNKAQDFTIRVRQAH
jgi:uncharacterized protein YcfL